MDGCGTSQIWQRKLEQISISWNLWKVFAKLVVYVIIMVVGDTGSLYSNIASGAESGWDFSSRWLLNGSLSSIRTRGVAPVDLNAVLCQNEATLAKFYRIVGKLYISVSGCGLPLSKSARWAYRVDISFDVGTKCFDVPPLPHPLTISWILWSSIIVCFFSFVFTSFVHMSK